MEALTVHCEFLPDHVNKTDKFEGDLTDDGIKINIIEEGVLDRLLRRVLVHCLLEHFAEAIPPTTEPLGRVNDVPVESFEGRAHILNRRVVVHILVVVGGLHLDEGLSGLLQEGLVRGKGANDHLVDRVEDLALPVLVVNLHFLVALGGRLERLLLDRLQVVVADVLIVFYKSVDLFVSVGVKVVAELLDVHNLLVVEVNRTDDASIFDCLHLLLDVASLLEHATLGVFEVIDFVVALLNVLRDGEGEPVVILKTFVHLDVKLANVLVEELLLYAAQVAQGRVVRTKQLIEAIDMHHVVLLLESNVDDGVRDVLANSVKELTTIF